MEIEKIIESIQSTINSNDLSEYTSELETIEKELTTLGEQYSSQTISAAILKMYTDFKNKEAEKKAKQDAKVASDAEKATKESNVQRFFINVGMMDNLDKDSLMKLIMDNVEGVKDTDFTDVYLKDSFSFFELPKTYSDAVLAKLVGLKVGEREVNVELSEKKERSSSRGGRSSYRGGDRGDYGDRRSYSHRDDSRSSYRHNDDRSYSRSNDDMGGYAKENPGSYTESKHGRFSRDSKPRGGYSRKKY